MFALCVGWGHYLPRRTVGSSRQWCPPPPPPSPPPPRIALGLSTCCETPVYVRGVRVVREDVHTRAHEATGVGQGAGLVPPATPPQPSWMG